MKFIKIYSLFLSVIVFIGFCSIFLQHKVVLKTLATTGADFEVVCGNIFMDYCTDSINNRQIYVVGTQSDALSDYINQNTMSFSDYFIVSGNIKDYRVSDSEGIYNPVLKIKNWSRVSIIDIFIYSFISLVIPFFLYFVRYLLNTKRRF